jgi:hypothetical protein
VIKVSGRVNIRGAFNEVLKKIERAMIPALDNEIAVIKARTLAGNDVNGGSFRPYSEDYREFKGKATNTPNPTVNLSGVPGASAPQFKMLQSIFSSVEVQGSKVIGTISFNNAAAAIKAAANQKTRRFFGLSKAQRDRLVNTLRKAIK